MGPGKWLLAASASLAALISLTPADAASAGQVALSGKRIVIEGSGNKEHLLLRRHGSVLRIDERNANLSLETDSPACTANTISQGRSRVECPLAGVKKVQVALGGGNDRLGVGTALPSRDDRNFCRHGSLGARLILDAGAGRDVAELSNGDDRARGGRGGDLLLGCRGDDRLAGGGQRDDVSGDRGADIVRGGNGRDWLVGCRLDPDDRNYPADEPGRDKLNGGRKADFLYGCRGRDAYRAGRGSDALNTRDDKGEPVRCQRGNDLVYGDVGDRLSGCERTTECTTDNFPFLPCNLRARLLMPGAARAEP
jgi:hypothetical protein